MDGHPTPSSFTSCVSGSSLCRDAGSSLQFRLCRSSPCQLWVSYRVVSMEMSVMWTSPPRRRYDKRSVSPVFVLGIRKPDAAAAVLLRFCRTAPKESERVRNERTQQAKRASGWLRSHIWVVLWALASRQGTAAQTGNPQPFLSAYAGGFRITCIMAPKISALSLRNPSWD